MDYSTLVTDRDLHAALLRKVAKAKHVDALGAIVALSNAESVVALRSGGDAPVDAVLAEVNVPFTLGMVRAEYDEQVRQLAVEVGKTSGPVGSRTDAHGRVQISNQLAARIIANDEVAVERWLTAKQLGLPDAADQRRWTQTDRTFAAGGADLLETQKLEQRARDAQHAPRRGRNVEPSAGPYGSVKKAGPLGARNPVQWDNEGSSSQEPREGRVIALDASGAPSVFTLAPYPLFSAA